MVTDVYINGSSFRNHQPVWTYKLSRFVSGSYNIEVRKTGYISGKSDHSSSPRKAEDYIFEIPFENADLTLFVQEKDQKMVPNATIIINGMP